ncbi:MAG TPA: hypothetical protein VFM93_13265, partial [Candidatus Limnocylindria bacterium]|nr:hypothetical protein [Candidatus Limnocylindria bacterium]
MRTLAFVAALTAAALGSTPAAAASEGAIALQVCGRLVEHRPATATDPGRLVMGTRSYVVAPATVAGNGGVEVATGRVLCVEAAQGRTSGQLLRYLFYPSLPGPTCGNVLAVRDGGLVHLRAEFGLAILARAGVPEPRPGERVCYVTSVAADGDLAATGTDPVDTTLEREWAWHCGTVRLYRPATATTPGTITVGSETFAIARGTAYTGDPAGDRTDRTTAGQNMCLRGVRGPDLALIEYLTGPMSATTGGIAHEYVPPSGGTA